MWKLQRNYITGTVFKLSANTIKNKINTHLEVDMAEEKCGFKEGRNCVDAILT
jgi:hypothetical protein